MSDLLTPRSLTRIVNNPELDVKKGFLTETFFKTKVNVEAETVDFKVDASTKGLARFNVVGNEPYNVALEDGASIQTVKLPYIFEEKVLNPNSYLDATAAGKVYIGAGDVNAAKIKKIGNESKLLLQRANRRIEWMAAKMLQGGFTETNCSISLGLAGTYTPTHTGTDLWTDAASKPSDHLMEYSQLIQRATGSGIGNVVLGKNAAKAFINNVNVKGNLDTNNLRVGAIAPSVKSLYLGNYMGVDFWQYAAEYWDGSAYVPYIPVDKALFVADNIQTDMIYGMIPNELFTAVTDFAAWSAVNQSGTARHLYLASRPLPMVYQAGSVVIAKVV